MGEIFFSFSGFKVFDNDGLLMHDSIGHMRPFVNIKAH